MKILFVNQHMKMGGIASSLYNSINKLVKNKDLEIELVCFHPYFDKKYEDLKGRIKVYTPFLLKYLYLSFNEAKKKLPWWSFLIYLAIKGIAKIIGVNKSRLIIISRLYFNKNKKYDFAISYSNDIPINNVVIGCNNFVISSVNSNKKIAWVHNDLEKLGLNRETILKNYAKFDKVVNVSKSCKGAYEKLVPEFSKTSFLVHNYLDPKMILKKAVEFNPYKKKNKEFIFVTVARIENKQKRIDRIINIVKKLSNEGFKFKWYIIGDGPDLKKLQKDCFINELNNFIFFEGFQQNPYPYIKYANCFVLTSEYEAQGMVISESLIIGTPVITTNFPAAIEFVKDGDNGKVVKNNTESIYQEIKNILENDYNIIKYKNGILKMNLKEEGRFSKDFEKLLQ